MVKRYNKFSIKKVLIDGTEPPGENKKKTAHIKSL